MFEIDSADDLKLTVNQEYAKRFEHNKKREELHRLQEKYGKAEESSDDTDEDEDAMYDSIAKDKAFLRVLSKLKSKDPAIYDTSKSWYNDDPGEESEKRTQREEKCKPMFLKDYERETLLQKGSLVINSDDEDGPQSLTYNEEQRQLKDEFKAAVSDDNRTENDAILTLRSKTPAEKASEEEDYRKWLKGEKTKLKDGELKMDCAALHEAWTDPSISENEKFLRNFILNKGWLEKEDENFVPAYDDIIRDDEDDDVEQHEEFERQFNFRYEEPNHDLIKNYPRTIANSVRKPNESRKEKRKRKEERKLKEKEEKRQDIERLKKLKLEEIENKIKKLSENAGKDLHPALHTNLDSDFNSEEHDKIMSTLFNDEYYDEVDPVKPTFESDDSGEEDFISKVMEKLEREEEEPAAKEDDPNIIYKEEEEENDEAKEKSKKRSWKRKRGKKFKEAVTQPKPLFDPDSGTFEKYFDEYYKLDCEDIIGNTRCRFGYRKVKPCSYGLTVDEILKADEKELNQWFSFKKMMKYRSTDQESRDLKKFSNAKHNEYMKRQLLPSLFEESTEGNAESESTSISSSTKGRKQQKQQHNTDSNSAAAPSKPSKKKKKSGIASLEPSRLKAYGIG